MAAVKMAAANTLIDAIRCGNLQLQLPQTLPLRDGENLQCMQLLRLLPGKRGVFKAHYRQQTVLAKIFLDSAARQVAREHTGYERLLNAQQPTPKLIATLSFDGGTALLFEFLADAQPLFREDVALSAIELQRLLDRLQAMYANGIYHDDLHWGNFLWSGATAFVIDAGAVLGAPPQALSSAQVTDNLGVLIAQFRRGNQDSIRQSIASHPLIQDFRVSINALNDAAEKHWQRRKKTLLNKCFRDTTAHRFVTAFSYAYAYRRSYAGADLAAFLQNPDKAMAQGSPLKLGNSATVAKLTMDGRTVVVKRYNMKNIWHWLRRCWRPSRAWNSWRNAHWLELLGLHTPSPIAFLEMRCGRLRRRAYYVSEFIDGEILADMLNRREPTNAELMALENYFSIAASEHLIHGDMKATNFLLTDNELAILDLDAMQEIDNTQKWRKLFALDFARFERNLHHLNIPWMASLKKRVNMFIEGHS